MLSRFKFTPQPAEINHIRFYFGQIEKLRKVLDNEQMGRLFFNLADYAMGGERREVEPDILYPYEELCYKIDKARQTMA